MTQRGVAGSLKRGLDIVLALILSVVLAPVLLVVALVVRWSMGSPVFFLQRRLGAGGRIFTIRKFRTMRDDRDAAGALLPDEERTPAAGRWLRRLRLDELPEVWNLLVGDMSLVGPRPLLPSSLDELTPFEARRLEVRPGITGWAQVSGNTRLTLQDKARLDVWYIDHWSLRLDAVIVLRTLAVVLGGERVRETAVEDAREHANRVDRSRGRDARGAGGPQ